MLRNLEFWIQILAPISLFAIDKVVVHLSKPHFLNLKLGIIMLLISEDYYSDTGGNVHIVNI